MFHFNAKQLTIKQKYFHGAFKFMFWATLSDIDKSPFNPGYTVSSIISFSYVRRRFCLPPAFTLVSCSAYSLALNMDVACSSETSVHFQRTIQRYIPEDRILLKKCCFASKSVKFQHGSHFPRPLTTVSLTSNPALLSTLFTSTEFHHARDCIAEVVMTENQQTSSPDAIQSSHS
jgi:hypothetical protein